MKIALVTTTINVPHVLRLYRRCDPDVRFFVAIEQEFPKDLMQFLEGVGNTQVCQSGQWKCSELIGWKKIQRRNIATLEALKWGADVIVFVDDDNIPVNDEYFTDYERQLHPYKAAIRNTARIAQGGHSGFLASPEVDWFDVGAFLDPPSSHRGFPHQLARRPPRLSHVVDAKIGAVAGIVLGDPDISAVTRIAKSPHVLNHSPLLNAGIAVNPVHTRTVFNTQNSAVLRELALTMLLCPQFGRYDDIIASLVCQRVMADTGHHVLFGPPFVYQERNAHDLSKDLADEAWGQAHILDVQAALWDVSTTNEQTAIDKMLACYAALDALMPGVAELAHAWADDCERAMG